uniref:Glycosyltransferase n=1 Tax=viral metagenome TaxID=1070528 RepID=A0A6C0BKG5_9ZZZZ
MNKIPFYVVNFKNETRRNKMLERFRHFGVEPIFTPEVGGNDPRLDKAPDNCKRVWAVMLQHLDSLRHFVEKTQQPYCIVCEDDIHLSRHLINDLEKIVPQFQRKQLDVLLLGCLLPFAIDMATCLHRQYFPMMEQVDGFSYHRYPDDLWGCQMYLISRDYSRFLISTYTIPYALDHLNTSFNYNPDWVITKNGNRALVYPMVAVEEGVNVSNDASQVWFHRHCHAVNFNEKNYF